MAPIDVYRRLLEAWNRRNADDFAALFSADGHTIGLDGSPLNGPEAIAASLREIFAKQLTSRYVAKVREVTDLGPGVSLLRAIVGMVAPGQIDVDPSDNAIQSVVFVPTDGDGLRVALLHNTPAAFSERPQLREDHTRELTEVLRSGQTVGRA